MQRNSPGSYHHGFGPAQILLPRRLRNEAPSRWILPCGSPYSLAGGLWQTLGVSLWMFLARCVNGGTASKNHPLSGTGLAPRILIPFIGIPPRLGTTAESSVGLHRLPNDSETDHTREKGDRN